MSVAAAAPGKGVEDWHLQPEEDTVVWTPGKLHQLGSASSKTERGSCMIKTISVHSIAELLGGKEC